MISILVIYFFLLGLIIGSFLNVVVLRHNTGKSVKGRSACMTCRNQLGWRELVPVFSFLFLRGKCRHCRTRISWQYPLVELATGLLFAANFYVLAGRAASVTELAVSFILTSSVLALLVAICTYDLRHHIIPDRFSLSAFVLAATYSLLSVFWFGDASLFVSGSQLGMLLVNLGAGIIFYAGIWLIWKLSNGRLIGLGDAKLLLSLGTILGLVYGLSAIFLSFWIGTAFAVALMLKGFFGRKSERITMKSEIAFGPFLIVGFLIVYFLRIDVTNLGLLLEYM